MADNTFAPPRVDIAGNINDLITQYQEQQKRARAQQLLDQRRSVAQQIMGGQGDPTRLLMGLATQDPQGAAGLATLYKATHAPTGPKPMTAYQEWQKAHTEAQDQLREAKAAVTAAKPSPQQVALDRTYGKDFLAWEQGGKSETESGIATLNHAIDNLKNKKGISGPMVDAFLRSESVPGRLIASSQYKDAIDTADAHKRAVINSLRPILGSRPAQALIQSVIEATYNPRLDQPINLRRLLILKKNLETARDAKDDMAKYWHEHNNSLEGYTGKTPDQIDFAAGIDAELGSTPEPQPDTSQLSGFVTGGGQTTPTAAPAEPAPPDTGIPMPAGMQGIATPPPGGTTPTAPAAVTTDPRQMDGPQILQLARDLAQKQGMNKQQIIQWFAAHGVELPP